MIHHHMGEYPHIFIGEALEMAISALREQCVRDVTETSGWISVEERLPELESFVLCRLKGFQYGGNTQVCRYRAADKYVDHPYFDHYRNGFPVVTHWMPLPEPPKEEV